MPNHTAAGGSGFGDGGSLIADRCVVVGNTNTGDTTDSKGLAAGIGIWEAAYGDVLNYNIINNVTASFGAGLDFGRGFTVTGNGAHIINNSSHTSGGAIYTHPQNTITLNNCQLNNNGAQYGGGIAGVQAQSITLRDNGTIYSNVAGDFGGGIYAHTGSAAGTDTLITIRDNGSISGNTASNGGGISGGSLEMPNNIPTINLLDNSRIAGNKSIADVGGIWVPQPHLDKITAAATVVFTDNHSVQAYYMLDTSPDVAVH